MCSQYGTAESDLCSVYRMQSKPVQNWRTVTEYKITQNSPHITN